MIKITYLNPSSSDDADEDEVVLDALETVDLARQTGATQRFDVVVDRNRGRCEDITDDSARLPNVVILAIPKTAMNPRIKQTTRSCGLACRLKTRFLNVRSLLAMWRCVSTISWTKLRRIYTALNTDVSRKKPPCWKVSRHFKLSPFNPVKLSKGFLPLYRRGETLFQNFKFFNIFFSKKEAAFLVPCGWLLH